MSAALAPREPQRPTDDEQISGGKNPPSKLARFSSDPDAAETVTMAAPSPLVLGLGLGLCLGPADSAAAAKPPFTFMQMQELEQQALIYKYMAAGLPVPLHLVFPIWKSVAASACAGSLRYPSSHVRLGWLQFLGAVVLYASTTGTAWSPSPGGAGGPTARSGGAPAMSSPIRSTASATCTAAATVQESLWKRAVSGSQLLPPLPGFSLCPLPNTATPAAVTLGAS